MRGLKGESLAGSSSGPAFSRLSEVGWVEGRFRDEWALAIWAAIFFCSPTGSVKEHCQHSITSPWTSALWYLSALLLGSTQLQRLQALVIDDIATTHINQSYNALVRTETTTLLRMTRFLLHHDTITFVINGKSLRNGLSPAISIWWSDIYSGTG